MRIRWLRILLVVSLGAVMLWGAPLLLAWQLRTPSQQAQTLNADPNAVDALLAEAMPMVDATLLAEEQRGEVRYAVYQVPLARAPLDAAREVRQLATERGLEMYASPVDGLDAQIRAYAGAALRQELLLIPTLPANTEAPRTRNLRERPLLALIVSGLGDANAPWLANADIPLTLAIKPYAPFTLHLGEKGAHAWHEVIVDLNDEREALRDREQLTQAMAAVPFSTGVLSDVRLQMSLPDPFGVFVQTDDRGRPPVSVRHQWVPAQRGRRRDATETLSRTRLLASREGAAAMVIEATDPALKEILAWAEKETGFRLAFASEVLRADQVRGVNIAEKPD